MSARAIAILGTVCLAGCGRSEGVQSRFRTISVTVAAGPRVRRDPHWRDKALEDLSFVSSLYARFDLRWKVERLARWDPDARSGGSSRETLCRAFSDPSTEVVLGLAVAPRTASRGDTIPFTRHVFVRWTPDRRDRMRETIAHEFGHLLGAWHVRAGSSFMRPRSSGTPAYAVDADSARMIELARDYDFRAGPSGADAAFWSRVDEHFSGFAPRTERHPIALAYYEYGRSLLAGGSTSDALASFETALAWSPTYETALYAVAYTRFGLRDWNRAESALRRLLALAPEHRDGLLLTTALQRHRMRSSLPDAAIDPAIR